jgi:hypothetical protein
MLTLTGSKGIGHCWLWLKIDNCPFQCAKFGKIETVFVVTRLQKVNAPP